MKFILSCTLIATAGAAEQVSGLTVISQYSCTTPSFSQQFLSVLKPLATHVHDREPFTLTFRPFIFADSPDSIESTVLLFQRYENTSAYNQLHTTSDAMGLFERRLAQYKSQQKCAEVSVDFYNELPFGVWDQGSNAVAGVSDGLLFKFPQPSVLGPNELLRHLEPLMQNIRETEPLTSTYRAFLSQDNTSLYFLERWQDLPALKLHVQNPEFQKWAEYSYSMTTATPPKLTEDTPGWIPGNQFPKGSAFWQEVDMGIFSREASVDVAPLEILTSVHTTDLLV